MAEDTDTRSPYQKGVDIPAQDSIEVWNFILEKGSEMFKDTAFVTGEKFTQSDITALKRFYQDVFYYQEDRFGEDGAVFNQSLLEHLLLSEHYAEHVAQALDLDPFLLKAVMLTHDFGRIFSHRRGRNNVIADSLMTKLKFNDSFIKLLPLDTLYKEVDTVSVQGQLKKSTTQNNGIVGAVELIDVLAKWQDRKEGILRKWDDVIVSSSTAQKAPNREMTWPSELTRQQKITSDQGVEAIVFKYNFLKDWFERKSKMKINELIKRVEVTLREKPLQTTWA